MGAMGKQTVKEIRAAIDKKWSAVGLGTPTPLP